MKPSRQGKLFYGNAHKRNPPERSGIMPGKKPNLQAMDPEARAYFNSMPQTLKEQIVQSGVSLPTVEDLKSYEKNALDQGNASQ